MESPFSPSEVRNCSTAEKKQLNFSSDKVSSFEWQHKRIDFWTPSDTINWVMNVACGNGLNCEEIHKFREVDGHRLISMSEVEFIILQPNCGNALYKAMKTLQCEQDLRQLNCSYDTNIKIKPPYLPDNIKEKSNISQNDNKSQDTQGTFLCSSTAVNKQLNLPSNQVSACRWQHKRIDQWTPSDTVNWVMSVARDNKLKCDKIHYFCDVDGKRLISMSETEFLKFEPNCGRALYRALQILCKQSRLKTFCCPPPKKNRKKKVKIGRLWEFIRDLLQNPEYCPSLVRWENHNEGIFKFVDSSKVAGLWGTIKENPKMTYEKFSRAIRYYYKRRIFEAVLGQKLVYKFGPKAKGWQTSNPNFSLKEN